MAYMDNYLRKIIAVYKKLIKKDRDICIIIDGREGSGKSVFAMQVAAEMNPNFSLDHIAFTPEEFITKIKKAKKYQVVLFDEAFRGMSAIDVWTPIGNALLKMIAEIRQKNLFIIIVMPSFFELQRYFAVHRAISLFHIFEVRGKRGYWSFYSYSRKKRLYLLGKRAFDYKKAYHNCWGYFHNHYVISEKAYRKRKLDAFNESMEKNVKIKDDLNAYERQKQAKFQALKKVKKLEEELKKYKN